MKLCIILFGVILLSTSISASIWDLSNGINNIQNSIQVPEFLTKPPQNTVDSIFGSLQIPNFTCIKDALQITVKAIMELKSEIDRCGDNVPEDIKNVIESTNDIILSVENVQTIYDTNCAKLAGVTCVTKIVTAVSNVVSSVHVTNGLIAKVPNDPTLCGVSAVLNFGVNITDQIIKMKC